MRIIHWEKKYGKYNMARSESAVFKKIFFGNKVGSSNKKTLVVGEYGLNNMAYLNIWICHTNFLLLEQDILSVEKIYGIEQIKVLTPYRFEIVIGNMFSDLDIRKQIQHRLTSLPQASDIKKYDLKVQLLKDQLSSSHKYWAILIKDSKITHMYGDESEEEFQSSLQNEIEKNKYDEIIQS